MDLSPYGFHRCERAIGLDQVPTLEWSVGEKNDRAEHVREGFAGGEGERQSPNAQAGDDALVREARDIGARDDGEHDDEELDHGSGEGGDDLVHVAHRLTGSLEEVSTERSRDLIGGETHADGHHHCREPAEQDETAVRQPENGLMRETAPAPRQGPWLARRS